MPSFVAAGSDADISQHRENLTQDASSVTKQTRLASKKQGGRSPAKNKKRAGHEALL
jgi:hypothetical protein